ncbi:hypothetical protein COLO4_16316 [Corchorus olitorius]|uniref:Uncharacterized protein n=1 Tax=Corchorus olitorius TaxID=93759 RepID=A0A1R3JI60_9ROSI|nr:hypothetical protein COLO4_16316 [Corchorus olitorius]
MESFFHPRGEILLSVSSLPATLSNNICLLAGAVVEWDEG